MAWFGQFLGTAYTGQWWGDVAPTPPQPDAGGAVYTGGWEQYLLKPQRRAEIAAEVSGKRKPTPEVQEVAAEVAHEWLRGDYRDEDAAARELELIVRLRKWLWRENYVDLLRAYHAEMAAERARQVELQTRKRRQALAMLTMLANL